MLSYLKTKKNFLISILIISVLAVFFVPHFANAGSVIADSVAKYVGITIAYLLIVIIKILGIFLGLAGWLMDQAITFKSLRTEGVVKGWEILRDIVNMFFILILLVVAFATVLNIPKYSVKDILPRLVIVALLINFSLPLVYVVVDAAQITMYGIYNAMTSGLSGDCAGSSPGVCFSDISKVAELLVDTSDPIQADDASGAWTRVMNLIMAIIFLFIFTVVVAAGAMLLTIRIVGIWIAAIFSPLAFFSRILPGTSFFFNTWMKKFLQYTFFGPLYVFFLWISLILLQYTKNFMETAGITPNYNIFPSVQVSGFMGQVSNVLQFIMVIVLLLWSFLITRQMGIKYGEKIASGSEKFLKDAAWTADRFVARGGQIGSVRAFGRTIPLKIPGLQYLSYGAQKRGWAAHKQKVETSAYGKASGDIENKLMALSSPAEAARSFRDFVLRRPKRGYQDVLRYESEVHKKQNEISSAVRDEDQLVSIASGATDPVEKEAVYRQMAATNALNTFFGSRGIRFNARNFREHMRQEFGEKEGARVAAEISAIAIGSGNYALAGVTQWGRSGIGRSRLVFGDDDTHRNAIRRKMRELEPQRFMGSLHPDSLFERDEQGNLADVSMGGDQIINNLTADHFTQFTRMQLRTQIEMVRRIDQIRSRNQAAAARVLERLLPGGITNATGVHRDLVDLQNPAGTYDAEITDYINRTYQR